MYLKAKNCYIYFLQDTGWELYKNTMGVKKIFLSSFKSFKSHLIPVNDNCEFELCNLKQDEGGNYNIFDVKIWDTVYSIFTDQYSWFQKWHVNCFLNSRWIEVKKKSIFWIVWQVYSE